MESLDKRRKTVYDYRWYLHLHCTLRRHPPQPCWQLCRFAVLLYYLAYTSVQEPANSLLSEFGNKGCSLSHLVKSA